jgi:hypothetical protein
MDLVHRLFRHLLRKLMPFLNRQQLFQTLSLLPLNETLYEVFITLVIDQLVMMLFEAISVPLQTRILQILNEPLNLSLQLHLIKHIFCLPHRIFQQITYGSLVI